MVWTRVQTDVKIPRLSHTATQVGSYLFVIGGHDGMAIAQGIFWRSLMRFTTGQKYAQDVLLFNLGNALLASHVGPWLTLSQPVTLEWETKPIHGVPPAGRGYRTSENSPSTHLHILTQIIAEQMSPYCTTRASSSRGGMMATPISATCTRSSWRAVRICPKS